MANILIISKTLSQTRVIKKLPFTEIYSKCSIKKVTFDTNRQNCIQLITIHFVLEFQFYLFFRYLFSDFQRLMKRNNKFFKIDNASQSSWKILLLCLHISCFSALTRHRYLILCCVILSQTSVEQNLGLIHTGANQHRKKLLARPF